ncbi:MAG: hypothetical protein GY859_13870 [Desulfobacterales bacterium]|nr:hypothetical protein [Desulfobacterales bacterium]
MAGWGQVTQEKERRENLLDPTGLMAEASRQAAKQTGDPDILKKLDGVMVVRVLSRHFDSTAGRLVQIIGAHPRFTMVSKIGGNSPQSLINKAAGMIARGELDSVLVAGGEAYCQRGKNILSQGASALFMGMRKEKKRKDIIGASEIEMNHGVSLPIHGFPLYETALWAESGLDIQSYLKRLGRFWSGFSRVAAEHPNAWIKIPRSAREIITPGDHNRRVAFPYLKNMSSMLSVDQGAAMILMSEEKAAQFRDHTRRPVYFRAGAYAEDRQPFLIQKTNFTSSPPLKAAAQKALKRGGMTLDQVDCFDIYSCFPCSVTIARRMLGLQDDEQRPLTMTGGMGFFGGPGNNYSLHSAATLVEAISRGDYDNGMITSLGWFMHKHAVGIYSAHPATTDLHIHDLEDEKDFLVGEEPVKIIDEASGRGVIETYSVYYSRAQKPVRAVIFGKTDSGFRFVARPPSSPDIFNALTTRCHVGQPVRVRYNPKSNLNFAELI